MTVRNPVDQVWSFYFQELQNYKKSDAKIAEAKEANKSITEYFQDEVRSLYVDNAAFDISSELCEEFVSNYHERIKDYNG